MHLGRSHLGHGLRSPTAVTWTSASSLGRDIPPSPQRTTRHLTTGLANSERSTPLCSEIGARTRRGRKQVSMPEERVTTAVGEAAGSIRLHVGGDWAVADLEKLLSGARQIYSAGLVAHLARSTEAEAIPKQPEETEQQEVRVELEPIGFGEPGRLTVEGSSYDVAEAVSAAIHRAAPRRRSEPVIHGFSAAEEVETFRLRLLQGDSLAVAPEAQLQIDSISMASPGWVDLKGSGGADQGVGQTDRTVDSVAWESQRRQARQGSQEAGQGNPGGNRQIQDVLSGVRSISDLSRSGHLLPPPATP